VKVIISAEVQEEPEAAVRVEDDGEGGGRGVDVVAAVDKVHFGSVLQQLF